jgi:AraC-like DNA-binding protein
MISASQPQERFFVASTGLTALDGQLSAFTMIEDLEESLRQLRWILPVRRLRPQQGPQGWRQRLARSPQDSLPLLAADWPALAAQVEAADDQHLTAIHLSQGHLRLRQRSSSWQIGPGDCALLSPQPFALRGGALSCVIVTLSKQRLLHEGGQLLGTDTPPRSWTPLLKDSDGRLLTTRVMTSGLGAVLGHGLAMVSLLGHCQPWLPERFGGDRLIHQLVALMLFPELRRRQPLERLVDRGRRGHDAFDDLLETISSHLHQPLSLDWLVQTSHYSARTLQYKFRQRLGCTATDWIRTQRLELARRRLQHPRPGDTVASIASECGYRTVNLFSVDFQQRFHVRPSDLLREAQRRGLNAEGSDLDPLSG